MLYIVTMNPRTLYLIKRMEIEVTTRMSKVLAEFELTPIQYTVLYFVDYERGDLSSAQLSRRFSTTPQSMNELVAVLQKKRLLKKSTSPNHKRILHLNLSERGKAVLDKCNHKLDEIEEGILESLTQKEIQSFRELAVKMIGTLRN